MGSNAASVAFNAPSELTPLSPIFTCSPPGNAENESTTRDFTRSGTHAPAGWETPAVGIPICDVKHVGLVRWLSVLRLRIGPQLRLIVSRLKLRIGFPIGEGLAQSLLLEEMF